MVAISPQGLALTKSCELVVCFRGCSRSLLGKVKRIFCRNAGDDHVPIPVHVFKLSIVFDCYG